jgi:hypothetical protein
VFEIIAGVRDLGAVASCDGIWMSPGDVCSVVEAYPGGDIYESWSRTGTPPVLPAVPAGMRHPVIKVLDPDGRLERGKAIPAHGRSRLRYCKHGSFHVVPARL